MGHEIKHSRRSVLRGSVVASAGAVVGVTSASLVGQAPQAVALESMPPTVQNLQSSLYAADNTTFGTAHISGTYVDCAVVFTAPDSGRVTIHWSGGLRNIASSSAPVAYLSPEVRAGGTVGSGTVVLTADNARSVRTNLPDSSTVRAGASHLLSGLAPAATYNARILHRVTSFSGEFFQRGLIVVPAP